jgi:hypothetical protein
VSRPDASLGPAAAAGRSHDGLLVALVLAFTLRAVLSFADAWSLYRQGVRFVPISDGGTVGGAPFWPFLWGVLSLAAALLLWRRQALGWVLGVAACVAYLVAGIGDAALFEMGDSVPLGAWALFLVDLAGPAIALALLFSVRPWFLSVARPIRAPRRSGSERLETR